MLIVVAGGLVACDMFVVCRLCDVIVMLLVGFCQFCVLRICVRLGFCLVVIDLCCCGLSV